MSEPATSTLAAALALPAIAGWLAQRLARWFSRRRTPRHWHPVLNSRCPLCMRHRTQ
jgi:hypothetical protein